MYYNCFWRQNWSDRELNSGNALRSLPVLADQDLFWRLKSFWYIYIYKPVVYNVKTLSVHPTKCYVYGCEIDLKNCSGNVFVCASLNTYVLVYLHPNPLETPSEKLNIPKNIWCLFNSDKHTQLLHKLKAGQRSKAKQNNFPITYVCVRFKLWPSMHTVHVHMQVDTCTAPYKQETSLNVRGFGESQNVRGQEILGSSNCTNKTNIFSKYWGGGGGVM